MQHVVIDAFVGATDTVFLAASAVMLIAVALAFLLKEKPLGEREDIPEVEDEPVPAEERTERTSLQK